jgi:hypothetical protein
MSQLIAWIRFVNVWPSVTLAILVSAFWIRVAGGQERIPAGDDHQAVRAAIAAFGVNRESFTYYSCRYQVTKAHARNYEAAIGGDWRNSVSTEYRLAVDGSKEVFECIDEQGPAASAKSPRTKTNKGIAIRTVPFSRSATITDGSRQASYSPGLKVINLFDKAPRQVELDYSPWSMAIMGHGRAWRGPDVMLSRPEGFDFASPGWLLDGQQPIARVHFIDRTHGTVMKFRLDPSRGHLPSHASAHHPSEPLIDGHESVECHLMGATPSKDRWFPNAWRAILTPGKPGGTYLVIDLVVTELNVSDRPAASDFSFVAPAGVTVCSPESPGFRLRQQETISVEDIPQLFQMVEASGTQTRMDTAIVRPGRWTLWKIAAAVAGLALAAWGIRTLWKRQPRTRAN